MLILVLLPMYVLLYFDAVVVFVTKSSLLFRLAVAILCLVCCIFGPDHGQKTVKGYRAVVVG